jgi:hypothetical protein
LRLITVAKNITNSKQILLMGLTSRHQCFAATLLFNIVLHEESFASLLDVIFYDAVYRIEVAQPYARAFACVLGLSPVILPLNSLSVYHHHLPIL